MIDVQKALSHPKGVYEYVNSLRKTLKPLTIEDESIKSGMERYGHIITHCTPFGYVSFERALLVVDYIEDYQVIRGFLWNYVDYENVTLIETMQSWIYMGECEENEPGELDFKFVAPQVKNEKGDLVCTNEKDMLPAWGDAKPDSFGNGICPIGRLHPLLVRNGLKKPKEEQMAKGIVISQEKVVEFFELISASILECISLLSRGSI